MSKGFFLWLDLLEYNKYYYYYYYWSYFGFYNILLVWGEAYCVDI
jgi:hypothetical protein